MMLKVTITVKVSDKDKDGYRDPSGFEEVDLYCVEDGVEDLFAASDGITSALLKVCSIKYAAALKEKETDNG